MPFALKVKSDVTAKGQSVFDESTLFSGSHGGVAILAKKSLHLHLIPLELPATYDFAFFLSGCKPLVQLSSSYGSIYLLQLVLTSSLRKN